MSGVDGGYLRANRIARQILFQIVDEIQPGVILESNNLATYLNSQNAGRSFSSGRVGCLLREREDLVNMRRGKWQKVVVA